MRTTLEAKVKRDSRSKLINTSRVNELKERYSISNVDKDLEYFATILNEDYYKSKWRTPDNFDAKKPFLKIDNKQFIYRDFIEFLIGTQQRSTIVQAFNELVSLKYNIFLESMLLQYQEENLENENEEFAHILGEYRDGLLLFDLMEKEIWKAASADSIGVQKYYQANKESYFFNERIDAVVASSSNKDDINSVAKLLKRGKSPDEIKKSININDEVHVIFTSAKMDANHQAIPKDFKFEKGLSEVLMHNDAYIIVEVKQMLPKSLKTLEEAKGKVVSDFQDNKEKNWLIALSKKYKVKINQEVLSNVKSKLAN